MHLAMLSFNSGCTSIHSHQHDVDPDPLKLQIYTTAEHAQCSPVVQSSNPVQLSSPLFTDSRMNGGMTTPTSSAMTNTNNDLCLSTEDRTVHRAFELVWQGKFETEVQLKVIGRLHHFHLWTGLGLREAWSLGYIPRVT